ncbi:M14 family metallopeptidase [Streptomyces diastatochromogenes]|uniref:hypothetical protein n=1 Tax=Streptomyces diastatochromogenes TaxID=42236 RepID=UPI0036B7ACE9
MEPLPAVQDGRGVAAEGRPRVPQTQRPGPHTGGVEGSFGRVESRGRADPERLPGVSKTQMMSRAPNQDGPEETGWRATAHNLNLNRDYTKANAPEMQAMLALLRDWDPLVCADIHVTDGADFEPDVSIQVEPIHLGDPQLHATGIAMRDALLGKLAAQGSLPLPFYPEPVIVDDPASGFQVTEYIPRYSTGYFPTRNRYTVLVETHSWKDYATRVRVSHNAIVGLAELVAAHSIEFRGYAYSRDLSPISGEPVTVYDPTTPQIWRVPYRGSALAHRTRAARRLPGAQGVCASDRRQAGPARAGPPHVEAQRRPP